MKTMKIKLPDEKQKPKEKPVKPTTKDGGKPPPKPL